MPMPHAIGEPTPKCPHGYWEHSRFNRCPWCHGQDQHNAGAIQVRGPGNGWLLKRDRSVCIGCGGPGNAGWGLLPSGAEAWTVEQHREYRARQVLCYGCTLNGLKMPIVELERIASHGLPGMRVIRSGDQTYWQCERCWRWGRTNWAHECNGSHWHATVRELREQEGSLPPPVPGDYADLVSSLPPPPKCLACGKPRHEHECQIHVAPLAFEPPSNEIF